MTSPGIQTPVHLELRRFIDRVPALGWSALPDGSLDYVSQRYREYTGLSLDELYGSGWKSAIHRDDIQPLENWSQELIQSREAGTTEVRLRRFDGSYRWFLVFANPLRDESGSVIAWYGTNIDIDDRKQAEATLRTRELSWRQIVDNIPGLVNTAGATGAPEFFNRPEQEYFGKTNEELKDWGRVDVFHPEDRPSVIEAWTTSLETGQILEIEARLRRADGVYRWFQTRAVPARDAEGKITDWYALHTDIEDRKRAEEALQSNERNLSLTINTMPVMAWSARPDGSFEFLNQRWLDYTGLSAEEARGSGWAAAIHPDDLNRITDCLRAIRATGEAGEIEARLRRFDGDYRWFLIRACPLRDESGAIVKWYGTNADIEDRKRAEEKLRQSEAELRTITDTVRQPIMVLAPDGTTLYANRVLLDIIGLSLDDVIDQSFIARAFHPDDLDRLQTERQERLLYGAPFDLEARALFKGGEYRWQLFQYNPLKDDRGQIIRWYVTATDIEDRKRNEERLRDENVRLAQETVYLEEQIRSEMGFEQIIGNSPALQHVLDLVETVAPNDSTVLLLGETGTGKELIARAVHERSRRKAKTFVKLNCAAIPTGLLESELFGHEKGAFTGAIIQKAGRMELADQGTLFLDEVGDIPIDIQPKLLRALQEREFERLGSTHTRKVNLRLVAATNRNLEKMVADREFRSDLFYRLNVFPIRIPPLRERRGDIPLLVSFFVQKFAKQMHKRIDSIPVATMKALTAWDWPGNIRELENFIERAVILTKGESLAAPLAELRKASIEEPGRETAPKADDHIARIVKETITSLKSKTAPDERTKKRHDEIVRVLTECKGRVGGADGAAVRMGLSRTTLIARIKKLGIDPYDYA
jgi:formate hydrogenlyase transcriptional activator